MSYQHYRRKKAMLIFQSKNKELTDKAVKKSLAQLGFKLEKNIDPKTISDVWGRGVMAFEYQVETTPKTNFTTTDFKKELETKLATYAKKHQLESYEGNKIFEVSDIWIKDDLIHFDISYLVNKATVEYVKDMHTLEENN